MLKFGGGGMLAALLFFWIPVRRRKWLSMFGLLLLVALGFAATGCGGNQAGASTSGGSGTTPGYYTVVVSGTSGSQVENLAVQVTVQ
jgi:hypothetical protein